MGEVWYRYVDGLHDPDRDPGIELKQYHVAYHTPMGVQLMMPYKPGKRRFVLNEGKKAFARPTKERALKDYYHRKAWEKAYAGAKYDKAQALMTEAKRMMDAGEVMPVAPLPWLDKLKSEE